MADKTPTNQTTQETYLGYSESNPQYFVGTALDHNKAIDYHAPSSIPLNDLAFNGTWTDHSQQATAGANATLSPALHRRRRLPRHGWERARSTSPINGRHLSTVNVSGIPKLYTLFSGQCAANRAAGLAGSPPACRPTTSPSADPDGVRRQLIWRCRPTQ